MSIIIQLAVGLSFIVGLFVLYRVLVDAKDATIQSLKEKISNLESDLKDARDAGPDVLVERYSKRVKALTAELEQLSQDHDRNAAAILDKESELQRAHDQLSALQAQTDRARELMSEFFCSSCGAPMTVRDYSSEPVYWNGRDEDLEHEYLAFECGLTMVDGTQTEPCRSSTATPSEPAWAGAEPERNPPSPKK